MVPHLLSMAPTDGECFPLPSEVRCPFRHLPARRFQKRSSACPEARTCPSGNGGRDACEGDAVCIASSTSDVARRASWCVDTSQRVLQGPDDRHSDGCSASSTPAKVSSCFRGFHGGHALSRRSLSSGCLPVLHAPSTLADSSLLQPGTLRSQVGYRQLHNGVSRSAMLECQSGRSVSRPPSYGPRECRRDGSSPSLVLQCSPAKSCQPSLPCCVRFGHSPLRHLLGPRVVLLLLPRCNSRKGRQRCSAQVAAEIQPSVCL